MSDDLYDVIFRVAAVLEVPVIVLALVALVVVVLEAGAFTTETLRRRGRKLSVLVERAAQAREQIDRGERVEARTTLAAIERSSTMGEVLDLFATRAGTPGSEPLLAKLLADFDFAQQRTLGRTRLLVRVGPALGLMGTLIPLSPALEGLAKGNVETLTVNLRVAFSITVLGLLVGAVAFAISLARDRIYGHDYSDLEYVAAVLTSADDPADPVETSRAR